MAKPLAELGANPPNSVKPAGGMGLTLTEKAFVPVETMPEDIAYVEFTANVTVSGSEGSPTDVVSSGEIVYNGRPIWVEFYAYAMETSTTSGDAVIASLWDGSTDLGRVASVLTPAAAATRAPVHTRRKITPSVGSHTYRIRAWKATNNGLIYGGAGGTGVVVPGYIRVTYAPL